MLDIKIAPFRSLVMVNDKHSKNQGAIMKLNKLVVKNLKNRKAKIFFIKNPIESWILRLGVPIFLLIVGSI